MVPEGTPFVARILAKGIDPPMMLFALRRLGVDAQVAPTTRGAADFEVTGTAKDIDALVAGMAAMTGALHAGDRHVMLQGGKATEHADAAAAESHLGGPFTVAGFPRTAWSHGGPPADHIVQILYFTDGHVDLPSLAKQAGVGLEAVAIALKPLLANQVIRKFRQDDEAWKDAYGLSRTARERIDALRR